METSFYTPAEIAKIGLAQVGTNVLISRKASLYSPEKIKLGNNVRVDDFCILSGPIIMGNYVHISAYTGIFAGTQGVQIGDFSTISGRCSIYGKSDDYSGSSMTNPMVDSKYTKVWEAPVKIEKHVIVGSGSVILPGVILREGTAIGAMSLVRSTTQAWSVYAGTPARYLHPREQKPLEYEKIIINK